MDQLTISDTTADHLFQLLRRLSPPTPPCLPPGSQTATALARVSLGWAAAHRSGESRLRDHVHRVRSFLDRVHDLDRSLF